MWFLFGCCFDQDVSRRAQEGTTLEGRVGLRGLGPFIQFNMVKPRHYEEVLCSCTCRAPFRGLVSIPKMTAGPVSAKLDVIQLMSCANGRDLSSISESPRGPPSTRYMSGSHSMCLRTRATTWKLRELSKPL